MSTKKYLIGNIKGPQGTAGAAGTTYTPHAGNTTTLDTGQNAQVTSRISGTDVYFDFQLPRGDTGQQGPRGEQGEQGEQGDPGYMNTITINLLATGWTGNSAPYSYDLGASYENKAVVVGIDSSNTTSEQYTAIMKAQLQGSGGRYIYAWRAKPTIDIPVVLMRPIESSGGGGGGSTVSVLQVLTSGTKIAELTIDGAETDLFAPDTTALSTQVSANTSDIAELKSDFQDGCNTIMQAVTAKGQTPASNSPDDIATAISNISTGSSAVLTTKTITENGTYDASSDNADGYSSVTVNVAGGSTPSNPVLTLIEDNATERITNTTGRYWVQTGNTLKVRLKKYNVTKGAKYKIKSTVTLQYATCWFGDEFPAIESYLIYTGLPIRNTEWIVEATGPCMMVSFTNNATIASSVMSVSIAS